MLDSLRNDFSTLLTQAGAIDFGHRNAPPGTTEQKIDNIEKEYANIRTEVASKISDLDMVLDIANRAETSETDHQPRGFSLKDLTCIYIQNLSDFVRIDMPIKMVSFHINAGDWCCRQQKWDNAFNFWERVLKHDPSNQQVHSRLNQFIQKGPQEEPGMIDGEK